MSPCIRVVSARSPLPSSARVLNGWSLRVLVRDYAGGLVARKFDPETAVGHWDGKEVRWFVRSTSVVPKFMR